LRWWQCSYCCTDWSGRPSEKAMITFILGAIAMADLIAALFFLRFWKKTRDRFFLFFSAAFMVDMANRAPVGFLASTGRKRAFALPDAVGDLWINPDRNPRQKQSEKMKWQIDGDPHARHIRPPRHEPIFCIVCLSSRMHMARSGYSRHPQRHRPQGNHARMSGSGDATAACLQIRMVQARHVMQDTPAPLSPTPAVICRIAREHLSLVKSRPVSARSHGCAAAATA